jgi:YD repeat-containing protein
VSRINPATGNPIENRITYNTLGQKLTLQDPDMGNWSYAYDLAGRLASRAVTKDNEPFKTLNYAFWPGTSLLKRVSDGNNNTLSEISLYSPQGKIEAVSFNGGKTVTTYSYFPLTDQSHYSVKRLNKRNIRDFIAAGIKQLIKGSIICLYSILISQKHISHENNAGVSHQGIIVAALDFFCQLEMLFGHFEKHLYVPSLSVDSDNIFIG